MENLQDILDQVILWARKAGRIQLEAFRSTDLGIQTKSSMHDVVTRIDKACEEYLLKQINTRFPTHAVLAEETGQHDGSADWLWIIDPLDGTNNYSQGLPIFCVSIGLQYKGKTVLGVVFAPYLDELYTAIVGQGSFLNGQPIHVSPKTNLNESVLATGFPYDKDVNPDNNCDNVATLIPQVRGLRRMGSAAYDLCCVAAGYLDGYWEFNLKPWDVCAGNLIVEEAGGQIEPFRKDRGIAIVAANNTILVKILSNLHVRLD